MPINVAVEEPRTRVVGEEADRDVVTGITDTHDVADYGIFIVVGGVTSAADNPEGMPVQMHGVLCKIVWSE